MPWIPENAPHNLLASVSASWNEWADGGSLDTAPHRKPPEVFACRILTDFVDPNGIRFRRGMEGQYLGMSDKYQGMAYIFIQGVTEGDGFTNRVVPRKFLELGKPWKPDLHDWRLSVNLETKCFNANDWNKTSQPDNTVFSKTVVRLIEAFVEARPPYATPKLIDYLERVNIASASRKIIQGVKDAGLYTLLSSPQSFKVQDLMDKAKFKFKGSGPGTEGGVYARLHVSNNKVTLWEKKTSYLYTGKTVDFETRFRAHQDTQSSYGELTRNSTFLTMFALCILDASEEKGMYFLTEQVFVCLFQTYRPSVLLSTVTDTEYLKHVQSARHFTDLATAVFKTTGWQGGIARGKGFGVSRGANCSSPLMEIAGSYEKSLFIRTDANIKDGKTGKVVPMAFYHRSNPAMSNLKKGRSSDGGKTVHLLKLSKYKNNKRQVINYMGMWINKKTQASQWPLPGTPFELVIEVCKDGSQHPYAWARLPDVGGFQNSTQANSFAVRVEWQHPRESGNWRFNYVQARQLWKMVDDKIPGSLPTHAKGITLLHWLTNSHHEHKQAWVTKAPGCARVLQAKYNFMEQSIRFVEQDKDIRMLPGAALSTTTIESLMKKPEYGLKDVGARFGGNFTGYGNNPNSHWKTTTPHTPEQKAATAAAEKALICQDDVVFINLPTFKQKLRQLENSEQKEDDASDYETDIESDDEIS
ncbi:hypothetical protein N0V86_004431 [Didymella sp. IMI 355093]|nr:hypothetical protein N0V86_004431 [Didymella sp. IMI 355093]